MKTWDVDLGDCDIHHGEPVLFVTLPEGVAAGDVLRIKGQGEAFAVTVLGVRRSGWPKHAHNVRFRSSQSIELRMALTYEVAR